MAMLIKSYYYFHYVDYVISLFSITSFHAADATFARYARVVYFVIVEKTLFDIEPPPRHHSFPARDFRQHCYLIAPLLNIMPPCVEHLRRCDACAAYLRETDARIYDVVYVYYFMLFLRHC